MDIINSPLHGGDKKSINQNIKSDLLSGFSVSLIALPLSLGIASASGIPPMMGVISAIIGGILVTFFSGSPLTIKGPAAGLIVIVAGAVAEMGGGAIGWQYAMGAFVIAGIIQILFGLLNLGKYIDLFPSAAIHGMLAAIGLIIIAKQIPILMGVDPTIYSGKGPIELFSLIPTFLLSLNPILTVIGVISLAVMIVWPKLPYSWTKIVPAPLIILMGVIPISIFMNFVTTEPAFALIKVGSLADNVGINFSMGGFGGHTAIFIKTVIMIALVGSLESLLTVKAIDMIDPLNRKSNINKDLVAVGIGNTVAAILGGYPMIAEVARSSSNVNNGGKTRWANFYHGLFLLIFVLVGVKMLELIPNAALAAMLIAVGIKLAHPKEFIHTYHIGPEQLAIFMTTIFFTLYEDLLIGMLAGITLKIIIHIWRGASFKSIVKTQLSIVKDEKKHIVQIGNCAVFTNYIKIKSKMESIPQGEEIQIELCDTKVIDHSVIEYIYEFKKQYENNDGIVQLLNFEKMRKISDHPLAALVKV